MFNVDDIKEINFIPDLERTKESTFIDTFTDVDEDMDVLFPPDRFAEMQEAILWDL